jgi:hypothetical protein
MAGPLGGPVGAAVVDESPRGRLRVFLRLREGVLTVSRKLLDTTSREERDFLLRRAAEYEADRPARAIARSWYIAACACILGPFFLFIPGVVFDNAFLIVMGVCSVAILPLVGLLLWLGAARRLAVGAWVRAAERALASTRNVEAALSAVGKCGSQAEDLQSGNSIIFDPLPTVKHQVRALRREAVRLGLLPPDTPPRKGSGDLEIPMEPW